MDRHNQTHYKPVSKLAPNQWDMLASIIVFGSLILLGWAATQMTGPYHLGDSIPISLDPLQLPYYALRTVLRMFIAMFFSLLFTLTVGTWAAKSKRAESLIIPAIDILQSVPILGFLSITIVGFIILFPNSMLGPECACIFVVFTAQAWNMVLSFYQSLKTLPGNLREASSMFHLTAWQRFWKIEVPFSIPSLLWNMMMSMSASWFMIVYSEAIPVAGQDINLPGIGSYIAVAIKQANTQAVVYAIIAMLVVILLYDQLLFRPLIKWSEKFRLETLSEEYTPKPWFSILLQRTRLLGYVGYIFTKLSDSFINLPLTKKTSAKGTTYKTTSPYLDYVWYTLIVVAISASLLFIYKYVLVVIPLAEIGRVFVLGIFTSLRVIVLIVLCSLFWFPIGVWVGRHPRAAKFIQPCAQFLAAFPANLLFPVAVMAILAFHLNVEIWVTPLMILGTQWYILFNVVAGASSLPKELYLVSDNFGVKGWLWWRRLIIPGVFPYYITGAITAAGGAWNASIAAEVVSWGSTTLTATGLGAYIVQQTLAGDFARIALGVIVMCLYVLAFNRLIWQPLYNLAQRNFQLDAV